jgi:uncharacterized Ntn-hydrolase superfamily protein
MIELSVSTYSVAGYDPQTGDLGVAVQSRWFNAGAIVPYIKAGVGAMALQSFLKYSYGPEGIKLLESGLTPDAVVSKLTEADERRELRQFAVVDSKGNIANFTGKQCVPWAGAIKGKCYSAQGNMLAGEDVVKAMAEAFEDTGHDLAEKLMAVLSAGEKAGGDRRGQQSAGLLVVRRESGMGGWDHYIDLRVDDNPEPIKELKRLLGAYRVEIHLQRGLWFEVEGRLDEALREFQSGVDKDPINDQLQYRLGCARAKLGQVDLAISALKEAFKINPAMRRQAPEDPNLAQLHNDLEFGRLLGS